MRLPRLTYVGHSYHRKTGSTEFIHDLLRPHFEIVRLWDESWQPGAAPLSATAINATQPDYLVLFQQLPRRKQLARIRCRNITWMPMHDSITHRTGHWRKFRGAHLKVFCFSRSDFDYFTSLGWETRHLQYFPPVLPARKPDRSLSVFFWIRSPDVTWETVKRLLGPQRPERTVLRLAADPGRQLKLPSPDDMQQYRIEIHEGWMEKERYRELLNSCSAFVAPRLREGIGQATLEAMGLGLAVVAPDRPTASEYLRHGVNGYLYDPDDPQPIDFANIESVRAKALEVCSHGHALWVSTAPALVDFVRKEPLARRSLLWALPQLLRP